jgi:predicted dehydrogenase
MLSDVGGNLASGSDTAAFDPGVVRAYERAEDIFADPTIHLVSICTRTDTHIALAEAAMRAGKHVLLEKPVALTTQPVRRLADIAAECGVVCMPAMCMRFWPAWAWLKEAVDNGRFGKVKSARFTRLGCRPSWSAAYADDERTGGALLDLHIHDTDFITWLFGEPAHVCSTGTISHVTTLYGYPQVPHVVAEGGWDQHAGFTFTMRYLVNFERATLDFDIARDPQLLLCRDTGAPPVSAGRTGESPAPPAKAILLDVEPITGYDGEIRHLIDCLTHNRRPWVNLRDAAVTHAVLDAERRSLETGEPVRLADIAG